MQIAQIHQGRQDYLFEADSASADAIAAVKYKLPDVVKALLVTPQDKDNLDDVFMLFPDHSQLMVDAGPLGLFVQRCWPGLQMLFGIADDGEA
ncbi:MAG: hypothetical protein LAD29_03200 [Rhodoferax sp.]|jgi:hypothetical protein|nr:hypothetical protein [Rhodoferax sp.]